MIQQIPLINLLELFRHHLSIQNVQNDIQTGPDLIYFQEGKDL